MTQEEIIAKVKSLDLPEGSYVVFGSAPLTFAGIREANDIDLLVSKALFEQLKKNGWREVDKGRNDKPLVRDIFEAHKTWDFSTYNPTLEGLLSRATDVEGIPIASLEDVRRWKEASGRSKDLMDLELIKKYKRDSNKKFVILLDGTKGAGKTTTAKILIKHLPDSIIVSLDEERNALADQTGTKTERNKRAFEKLFEKGRSSLQEGTGLLIDCGLTPERLLRLEKLAREEDAQLHKVYLKAPHDTLLARVRARDRARGHATDEARFEEVYRLLASKDFSGFCVLESDKLGPDEIARRIIREL